MKFEILHRIEGLDRLCAAIEALADARVKAARIAHPRLAKEPPAPPPRPLSGHDREFMEWLDSKGFPETRRNHYLIAHRILTGQEPLKQGFTMGALAKELREHGAPMPFGD